jgi:O-antigen/teichoic acid export membrane protein
VFTQGALPSVFTAQAAAEGIDAIRGAYVALTQRASAVSFPFLFFCAASAPLLLSGWLGRIPEHGTVILVVLCTAYVANVSSGVSYALAAAGDALALTARSATVTALANIALTVILSPLFGVWGVLAGTFVALSAGAIYQIVLVQRRFGIPLPHYWQAIRRSLQFAALAAIPVVAVSFLAAQRIPRVAEICLLLVLTGAYFAGYGVLAMRRDLLPGALSRPLARLPVLSVLAARD